MNTDPIFIVGLARTGSKIYKQMLSKHTNVDIAPELHFLRPFWESYGVKRRIQKEVGRLQSDKDVERLIDLLYSRKLRGTFWKIIKIDPSRLKEKFLASERTYQALFKILLEENAYQNRKERIGAKFPVHLIYANKLLEWFPNSRIIHLTRDPRAIYCSQLFKKKKKKWKVTNSIWAVQLHTILNYLLSARIHQKFKDKPNYLLTRYEDIVINPEKTLYEIASFVGIPYNPKMLDVEIIDSSFQITQQKGLNRSSLERWKSLIPKHHLRFMNFLLKGAMVELGNVLVNENFLKK